MTTPTADEVDELAAEFLTAAERGAAPDPMDWLARHPAHAAELAAFLANLGRFAPFLGLTELPADLDRTTSYRPHEPTRSEARVGDLFGGYELVEQIGSGGMGLVFRAAVVGTTLVVALKRLKPGVGGDEAVRFREEVEAAAGLDHPNIVKVYHIGEHAGRPFFTMPLIEGGSLDRHIDRFRGDPRAAAGLVLKIARAVHHAHQRQIVHRDLKPPNILLDGTGTPHVADFGLAARLDVASAADAGPAGSLPWMAPEAIRGEPVTTGVDVWALGVILYELLTGTRAFRGATAAELRTAILKHIPPPPRAIDPRVPPDLDAVCMRCLAKEPDRRYESASAVALELERWLQDRPIRARTPTRRERVARWYRHNPVLAWGALLLTALVVGGAALGVVLADEQTTALRSAVCQSNEHTAGHVANSVLRKFDDLAESVAGAADKLELRAACAAENPAAVRDALLERFPIGASPFETVYVLNREGRIFALIEPGGGAEPSRAKDVVGKSYPDRDYFLGARRHWREQKLARVHVSRVFRSDYDGKEKFAISCPIHPRDRSPTPWVLAATITTDDTLGLINLQGRDQKTALLAPRDPSSSRVPGEPDGPAGYLILVHEMYRGKKGTPCVPFPAGRPAPVPDPNDRPELSLPAELGPPPFAQDQNYSDPVAGHGHPDFADRWLTGSARVGNTEMVVIVQQRDGEAVAAPGTFFRRFAVWSGGVAALGFVLFAALSVVRARRVRAVQRQAG
jgi:serine/threonine-protein kinase